MSEQQHLKELQGEADKILKVFDARVTKSDLSFAVCLAMIEEFPQIRANQHVVDYFERLKKFQQQEEEGKDGDS